MNREMLYSVLSNIKGDNYASSIIYLIDKFDNDRLEDNIKLLLFKIDDMDKIIFIDKINKEIEDAAHLYLLKYGISIYSGIPINYIVDLVRLFNKEIDDPSNIVEIMIENDSLYNKFGKVLAIKLNNIDILTYISVLDRIVVDKLISIYEEDDTDETDEKLLDIIVKLKSLGMSDEISSKISKLDLSDIDVKKGIIFKIKNVLDVDIIEEYLYEAIAIYLYNNIEIMKLKSLILDLNLSEKDKNYLIYKIEKIESKLSEME